MNPDRPELNPDQPGYDRGAALHAIRRLGKKGHADELISWLDELPPSNPDLRSALLGALASTGDARVPAILASELRNPDQGVRVTAARALGRLGVPDAIQPLLEALNDSSSLVVGWAARGLGEMQEPTAVQPLIALLSHHDGEIRKNAAYALGLLGDPEAIEPLRAARKGHGLQQRLLVSRALRSLKRRAGTTPRSRAPRRV